MYITFNNVVMRNVSCLFNLHIKCEKHYLAISNQKAISNQRKNVSSKYRVEPESIKSKDVICN